MLEELYRQLRQDGFDFEVKLNTGKYEKVKTNNFRGWYATTANEHCITLTLNHWGGDTQSQKVYRVGEPNGNAGEIDEFIKAKTKEAEEQKHQANEAAKQKAKELWDESREEFDLARVPYLNRKGLTDRFGCRVDKDTGAILYIPCFDARGTLWGLQSIYPSGEKRFIKGQRKEGTFFKIGEVRIGSTIFIAEGFATGASLYQVTKQPTFIAWDASNLKRIAEIIREKFPHNLVIIAGDNDEHGTGQKAAEQAARAIKGHFICPGTIGKDWNDCLVEKGEETLKSIFVNFITKINSTFERTQIQPLPLHTLFTMELPEHDWIVKDMLIKGGTSSMSGAPKSGKSTLTRKLAICVAKGEPFLGRNTTKGKVLYVAVEEKQAQVKKHFQDLGAKGDEEVYVHSGPISGNLIEQLTMICKSHKPDLVILDTLQKTTGIKDLNDAVAVNEALLPFHILAKETDTHLLFVHHTSKGKSGAESIAGSMAIRGAFDANMLLEVLETNKKLRVFSSEQRYGVDFEPHTLDFDTSTRNPNLGLLLSESVVITTLDEIITHLRACEEPLHVNALIRDLRTKKPVVVKALKLGVKKGWLTETRIKNKKVYTPSVNAPADEQDDF